MLLEPSRPCDLALVIADLGPGGAQRALTTLADAWLAAGIHVSLITFADSSTDFFRVEPGIRRISCGGMGETTSVYAAIRGNTKRIKALRAAIRATGARRVLSFVTHTNVLTVLATRGLGTRVVISERNDPQHQDFGPVWERLRRLAYPRAHAVVAISEGTARHLTSYVPAQRVVAIPNPVRRPAQVRAVREPTILAVGRLVPQKAHDVLIRAFAQVADEAPTWSLTIVGQGPLRDDLEELVISLGVGARVRFAGVTADVWSYYARASIFSMASRFEGVGQSLLEAMSCGLPVIAGTASPGPLEYVDHGRTGLLVAPDDSAALAAALRRLIRDPDEREKLGTAAAASVARNDIASVLDRWRDVLLLPT